jgi:hypothetical protein
MRHLFLGVAVLVASILMPVIVLIVSVTLVVCLVLALVSGVHGRIIFPFILARLFAVLEIVVFSVFVVVLLLIL